MLRTLMVLFAVTGFAVAHDWNGLCVDKAGNVYVIDAEDGQIWRVSSKGVVSVFVPGTKMQEWQHPHHLAQDGQEILWLASG